MKPKMAFNIRNEETQMKEVIEQRTDTRTQTVIFPIVGKKLERTFDHTKSTSILCLSQTCGCEDI